MLEALMISNIVAWVIIVVLAIVVLALTRQVGILHERVAPAGALMPTTGPKVGELTKALNLTTIDEQPLVIGGVNEKDQASFILFISPTCPVCKSLVPTARSLVKTEGKRMRLVFASDGDELDRHKAYVKDLDIADYPYVLSQQLGMAYQVSKLPFAVLIDNDGILKSKGLVNTREHLESLIESMDTGIASVQEYLGQTEPKVVDPSDEPKIMEQTT